jgi:hypothetical protein
MSQRRSSPIFANANSGSGSYLGACSNGWTIRWTRIGAGLAPFRKRATRPLQAAQNLGFEIQSPSDTGLELLHAVHGQRYLGFLEEALRCWREVGEDWGDEGKRHLAAVLTIRI